MMPADGACAAANIPQFGRRQAKWKSRMPQTSNALSVTSVDPNVDLLIQLLKLASLINRPMQEGVAGPNEIGLNELKIVICLGGEGAMAGHDITELVAMPPMNVSRALAALVSRGWIEPAIDRANLRRKPFRLSAAGWAAYRAMTPDVGICSADCRRQIARAWRELRTK
jgi:DNA-binding MarR family transcriptional regulator